MGIRENECQISQNDIFYLHFSEYSLHSTDTHTDTFTILVKFDIHFLGLPCEIFFGVITDD